MKTLTLKQAVLATILALAAFFLAAWVSYQERGEFALGGELFVPVLVILAYGKLFGGKK